MKQLLPIIAIVMTASLAWGQTNSGSQTGNNNASASPSAPQIQNGVTNGSPAPNASGTAGPAGSRSAAQGSSAASQASSQTGMRGLFGSGQSVTFVTQSGQTIDEATAMTRVRSGACMKLQMAADGTTVERVTIQE